MRKRGRISSAAIGVVQVRIAAKERPTPPAGLTAREPTIVAASSFRNFKSKDRTRVIKLLVSL